MAQDTFRASRWWSSSFLPILTRFWFPERIVLDDSGVVHHAWGSYGLVRYHQRIDYAHISSVQVLKRPFFSHLAIGTTADPEGIVLRFVPNQAAATAAQLIRERTG